MNCVMGVADLVIDTCVNSPQIVGLGGFPNAELLEYVLQLGRGRRVLYDGTASPQYGAPPELGADVTTLSFYPWPPANLRELALAHDVIVVGGGNTANMLAIWRVHGFDEILREAWEAGIVLTGWSAGMICWFEAGVTDSFGPQLEGMRDGLGFLPGSACPHYDGEELRRPVYTRLVREGFPPGIALDDRAGAHFVGTELHAVVAAAGSGGYAVGPDGETALETVAP
jgi:peptidase E